MRLRGAVLSAFLAPALQMSGSASADLLHLHNGNTLEGVVLEETAERVRIRLPFGELGLPRSSIRGVERSESELGEFLMRWRELEASRAPAEAWLSLARWALVRGLDHNAREAARFAARLDPQLAGLAQVMRELGFVLDEASQRWVPFDDFMRLQGYVMVDGQWRSRADVETQRRARAEALQAQRSQARHERMARALELMVLTQVAQAQEARRLRAEALLHRGGLALYAGYPVAMFPGVWHAIPSRPVARRRTASHRLEKTSRQALRADLEALLRRPPGSLIPAASPQSHRGSFSKAPPSD